jgi:biopolymer transport protein ExbD
MRKFTPPQDEAEINLTPMLDIVFIMLIFFIVTSTFIKEAGLDINKPDSQNQPPEDTKKKNILVQIDNSNRIFINLSRVDIAAVEARIARLHAENPEGVVVIQPGRSSETGIIVRIYDQALLVDSKIQIAIAEAN